MTNVSVDASGLLTWDCDDEYYSTASIYNVVTNELIATPNVKSFQIPTDGTYRIKAKNIFGQYSKPAYVTYVKNSQYKGKVFSVDVTALSENNGTVTADVSVENIYPVKATGKTVVRVKDENGNVLARAYFDGLYEIGAVKSARVSLSAGTGAYTVEVFVTSSLNDDHADSAIYTVNIPELTNLTLNNPIVE